MEQQSGETEFKATGITSMFKEVWTIGKEISRTSYTRANV